MIRDGKGGARTTANGLKFEARADIAPLLTAQGFQVANCPVGQTLTKDGQLVGLLLKKGDLYRFLRSKGINHKDFLSKKLLPDNALLNLKDKTLYIVEVKFQEKSGSVDEKLQTCAFKKGRYEALMKPLGFKVRYMYVLNKWFEKPEYRDTLSYVEEAQCAYHFEEVPLKDLGL